MSPRSTMADLVLAEVRRTPGVQFGTLWKRMPGLPKRDQYRATDRALQTLRKRGDIVLCGRLWFPVTPPASDPTLNKGPAHSPQRLETHDPAPWPAGKGEEGWDIDLYPAGAQRTSGNVIATVYPARECPAPVNARRLAAAWNYAHALGLTTAEVEAAALSAHSPAPDSSHSEPK